MTGPERPALPLYALHLAVRRRLHCAANQLAGIWWDEGDGTDGHNAPKEATILSAEEHRVRQMGTKQLTLSTRIPGQSTARGRAATRHKARMCPRYTQS